ncbi:MAG TPA: SGNH/GDSL hydrolase family protein [Planctomycetota bacterium]|nr:SGNH/GDSL hydrolase family protein [Planctomycetota bacterium]
MKIDKGAKLLMIGDSITDVGRNRPIGEGRGEALGKGYVSLVEAHLTTRYPERNIRIVNMGSSGDRVRDLKARWQTDVLDQKPTWLSIMIGINDVWRQFDAPLRPEIHVLPEEYETTLDELVRATLPQIKGLVLLTPYYIETSTADPMRKQMDRYGAIVKKLAAKHKAIFVDTQAPFDALLKHMHPMNVAWDRVHPSLTGHMVLARAFLEGIGFEW